MKEMTDFDPESTDPQNYIEDEHTLRAPRRAWFCEGYDDGNVWTRFYTIKRADAPDIAAFRVEQDRAVLRRGLAEHPCRPWYEHGFDAGYCDGLDLLDMDA